MIIAKCKSCKKTFRKRVSKQIFCCQTCSNKFNLNNKHRFIVTKKYSKELAELFGILLGDGSVTKYYTRIYLNAIADKGYSKNIGQLLNKVFPKLKFTTRIRLSRGTEEVQISSVEVGHYLESIGFNGKIRSVPKWITKNKKFTIATIRGLFDTEGSIGIKRFVGKKGTYIYKQLTFTNKNKHLLSFVVQELKKLGFHPTESNKNNVYISNNKDIIKYFSLIGTSNPKLVKKLKIK